MASRNGTLSRTSTPKAVCLRQERPTLMDALAKHWRDKNGILAGDTVKYCAFNRQHEIKILSAESPAGSEFTVPRLARVPDRVYETMYLTIRMPAGNIVQRLVEFSR